MSATTMTSGERQKWTPIVLAALAAIGVAVLGGLMTDLGDWYVALRKPAWQPPDWLFGPAWTLIYALVAVAAVRAWSGSHTRTSRQNLLIALLINATLNVTWSLLFFRLQRPDWALFEVFFLWASIVLLIVVVRHRDRAGAWLLAPYLAWVTYAATVNYGVVSLNAPFAGG
jgi:benzodiazapine receptor